MGVPAHTLKSFRETKFKCCAQLIKKLRMGVIALSERHDFIQKSLELYGILQSCTLENKKTTDFRKSEI